MTDQTERGPFDLLLDDEWDVEPGDDEDIRDPEAILARMLRASAGRRGQAPHLEDRVHSGLTVMTGRASPARAT